MTQLRPNLTFDLACRLVLRAPGWAAMAGLLVSATGCAAPNTVSATAKPLQTTTARTCPDWSQPDAMNFNNVPPSNFGCATATDLKLMVANQRDLVRGTPAGPADADFAARAVELYRSGEVSKSLDVQSTAASSGSTASSGGSGSGGASASGGGS